MASAVKHISNEKEFEDIVKGDKLVICDFFATWCGSCKALAPKLEALAKEETAVVFIKVDVDELEDLSLKHEVSAMPTIIVFKHGATVGRFIGADIEKVKTAIAEHSK
nr:thioredoxin 2 [Hymenolepis microstoma]